MKTGTKQSKYNVMLLFLPLIFVMTCLQQLVLQCDDASFQLLKDKLQETLSRHMHVNWNFPTARDYVARQIGDDIIIELDINSATTELTYSTPFENNKIITIVHWPLEYSKHVEN